MSREATARARAPRRNRQSSSRCTSRRLVPTRRGSICERAKWQRILPSAPFFFWRSRARRRLGRSRSREEGGGAMPQEQHQVAAAAQERKASPAPPPPSWSCRRGVRRGREMREMLGPPRRGPAYKTKLCALWKRGSCSRASCSFAHGDDELRRPPSHSSFQPRPRPGGRDHRNHDLRGRAERRYSPRGRYSPGRDTRGHLFRDQRPRSKERESSHSRSPTRKGERRERKKLDGGKTDSSGSLDTSDKEDRKKDDKFSSSDEKDDNEAQLKQIQLDMETLREDKSKLEMILDKKIDEARVLSTRIDDLESQLKKEKEDYRRMTSKVKKLIRAHGRYVKAQDDLKRSQARFERFADLLASDTLKSGTKEQGSSGNAGNEDPYNDYEMSPSDQRHNHVSTARRRSIALSTSEEGKTGKKRRVSNDDMFPVSKKYRPEDALESLRNSKGTDTPKLLSVKKLGEGDNNEEVNVFSSSNAFADRYKGGDEDVLVD